MPVTPLHRNIVERLFHAMQMGPAGESEMLALFADNAVFIEPFSGTPRTHQGWRRSVRAFAISGSIRCRI